MAQKKLLKTRRASPAPRKKPRTEENFWIAGVGFSAGGLDAVKSLIATLPDKPGLALVLVQHIDPRHPTLLPAILTRITNIPVHHIQDGLRIRKDRIYVNPPGYRITLENKRFRLAPLGDGRGLIDQFLVSLAESEKNCAAAVILSGSGSDGSRGVETIKRTGGRVYVQDQKTARFAQMPVHAIETGVVDDVLPPEKIGEELSVLGSEGTCKLDEELNFGAEELHRLFSLLYEITHVDFSSYKSTTIRRRIRRRMNSLKIEKLDAYIKLIRKNKDEARTLYQDLLINVTHFFREPESFRAFKEKIIPSMPAVRTKGAAIRIWVPGCSTGEEAYSIAIALFEALGKEARIRTIQIFGTDISDRVLEKARTGMYSSSIEETVGPERLKAFFKPVEGGYQIRKEIREICIFSRQDVTQDPPFSRLDLISCRNMLIYLEPALQKRVIPLFHYALNPGGYLILGPSESIRHFSNFFKLVDKKNNFYLKKTVSREAALSMLPNTYRRERKLEVKPSAAPPFARELDLEKEVQHVLARYLPSAVLVNENMDIIQFHGKVSRFLAFPSGRASLNLMKMAKGPLLYELRECLKKARSRGGTIRKREIVFKAGGVSRSVDLEIIPIENAVQKETHFLVVFRDSPVLPAARRDGKKSAGGPAGDRQVVQQLQKELDATREYLESNLEQQESINEELKSANEEILSSNEELQSTNEELETAKEELQSTNEELTTVNEALNASLSQLRESNEQLAETQSIAHLGSWAWDLRSNRIIGSEHFYRMLNIKHESISLEQFSRMVHADDRKNFLAGFQTCPEKGTNIRFECRVAGTGYDHRTFSFRGRLVRDEAGRGERVYGSAQDITEIREMRSALEESERRFRLMVDKVENYAIFMLDPEGRVMTWNSGAERIEGYRADEIIGRSFSVFYPPSDRRKHRQKENLKKALQDGRLEEEGWRIRKDGSRYWAQASMTPVHDEAGELRGFAKIVRDLTEKKQAEEAMKKANIELEGRVAERTAELAASRAQFEDLYQHAPSMYLSVEVATRKIIRCNETLLNALGYKRDEIIGREIFTLYHKDDRRKIEEVYKRFRKTGVIEETEMRVVKKDGSVLNVLLSATSIRDRRGRVVFSRSVWRDITERKRADASLRESEARFRGMFENAAVGMARVSRQGRWLDVNQRLCEITGYSRKELLSGKFQDITHPDDLQKDLHAYRRLQRGEVPSYQLEKRYFRKDGNIVWVNLTVSLEDAHNPESPAIGIIEDITERKKAEQDLRESREQLRLNNEILETLNRTNRIISGELNLESLVQSVTDAATELSGAQFGAFFYNVINDQGEAYTLYTISGVPRERFSKFPMPRNTGVFAPTFHGEGVVRSDDITKDPRYGKNPPYNGMPKGHLPVVSYLAVPVTSRSGDVIGGLFFGHKDAAVFTERHERIVAGLASQAAVAIDNARLYDQLKRELEVRKKAEESLAEHAQQLFRSNEDLKQFAYIASHDLQEPLRTVASFTELLEEQYRSLLDDEGRNYIDIIIKGARRSQALVEDLLNYCQLERKEKEFRPVSLGRCVENAVGNLRTRIEEMGAEIQVEDLPEVLGEETRLTQLLQNLIGNALKFRSEKKPRVEVGVKREDGFWRFHVRDNGIGIEPQYQERIFIIFQRLHSEKKYSGTGIGLAVCKKIVDRHGGRIWVESAAGKGSTFFFTLPVRPERKDS